MCAIKHNKFPCADGAVSDDMRTKYANAQKRLVELRVYEDQLADATDAADGYEAYTDRLIKDNDNALRIHCTFERAVAAAPTHYRLWASYTQWLVDRMRNPQVGWVISIFIDNYFAISCLRINSHS